MGKLQQGIIFVDKIQQIYYYGIKQEIMATLHIKDFPEEFIAAMDTWGEQQVPTLNRRQVVTTIVKEWIETHQQESGIYPEQHERIIS